MKKFLRGCSLLASACLLTSLCMTFAPAEAQKPTLHQKFTVDQDQATLPEMFDIILKKTGYDHSGFLDDSLLRKKFPAGFQNITLKKFLKEYLPLYGLTYFIDPNKPTTIQLAMINRPATLAAKDPKILRHIMGTVFRVDSGDRELLAHVNILIKGTNRGKETKSNGSFFFDNVPANAVLYFTGVNLVPRSIRVTDHQDICVKMEYRTDSLEETTIYTNGIITKLKDSTTWVAGVVQRSLLQRSPESNALRRIEFLIPGMLFTHPAQTSDGADLVDNIIVRGPSTINAGTRPMVVVDNFPYYGNLNNINPEDIESVTVLKDASSLSLWGVSAGNAIIVITTRKGKTPKPMLTFSGILTGQGRPDVRHLHLIPAGELIDLEQQSYKSGYYPADLFNDGNFTPVPPVVSLLHDADRGLITREEAASRIAAMRGNDIRKDIERYFYQKSFEQQYTLQLSGESGRLNYFVSGGITTLAGNLTGTKQLRRTARTQLTYAVNKKLKLSFATSYAFSTLTSNNNPGYLPISLHGRKLMPTYLGLNDAQGKALPYFGDYKESYLHQLDSAGFHSAVWYPMDDMSRRNNRLDTRDYVANLGLQYTFNDRLQLNLMYQFEQQKMDRNDLHTGNSYYVNDFRNIYMQLDPVTGNLFSPVPPGGIADLSVYNITAHQARTQLNWQIKRDSLHALSLTAGVDFRDIVAQGDTSRRYGIDGSAGTSVIHDTMAYPPYMIGVGEPMTIPVIAGHRKTTDLLFSNFLTSTYTYMGKYTLSANIRGDIANLFGPATNNKWQPLWSAGAAWHVGREKFYAFDALPELIIQASFGTLGNISRLASAYTTMSSGYGGVTGTPYQTAFVLSFPNADLGWEKVKIFNVGIDFATKDHVFKGRIDAYSKLSTGLMAQTFLDPTLGGVQNPGSRPSYFTNSASMQVKGLDMELTSRNHSGKWEWTTNFLLSIAASRIKRYSVPAGEGINYLDANLPNPVPGRPLFAIYAYKWLYLDGQKGDPVGTWNGHPSTEWGAIIANTPVDSMVYKGPAQPPIFGAIRNTVTKGKFSLSWNISYRLGYYMRAPAFSSTDVLNNWNSNDTYRQRWQKPGDERTTNVPGLDYTNNAARDYFYANSDILAFRADNIRLEDIMLSIETRRKQNKDRSRQRRIFAVLSNVGTLWQANKNHIDPDYNNAPKQRMRLSVGFNFSF